MPASCLPRISEDPEDWRCKMCSWRERCWVAMSALNETVAKRIAKLFRMLGSPFEGEAHQRLDDDEAAARRRKG